MKNLSKFALALIVVSCTFLYVSGQTLKERIDEAKVVKVYFINSDIVHRPNTNAPAGSQQKGTGCAMFTETTPMPVEYIDAAKEIIDMLNKGFNTTAFVAGDISTVPLISSGMLKGTHDWVTLGEPLVFVVSTTGGYVVSNMGLMGAVALENSLAIESALGVIALKDGKAKSLESKQLVWQASPSIKTDKCNDFAYFTKTFPANSLAEVFKTKFIKNTNEFIEKQMKKYEKEMKKKK
jgi:hypothetical protein